MIILPLFMGLPIMWKEEEGLRCRAGGKRGWGWCRGHGLLSIGELSCNGHLTGKCARKMGCRDDSCQNILDLCQALLIGCWLCGTGLFWVLSGTAMSACWLQVLGGFGSATVTPRSEEKRDRECKWLSKLAANLISCCIFLRAKGIASDVERWMSLNSL